MIFTRDFVTRENHCRIASLVTKIVIHANSCIILYFQHHYEISLTDDCYHYLHTTSRNPFQKHQGQHLNSSFFSRTPMATFHDSKHSAVFIDVDVTRKVLLTVGKDKIMKVSLLHHHILHWALHIHFQMNGDFFSVVSFKLIIPHNEVYWFHSVRLSVRPSVHPTSRVHSVVPTVLVGSMSYLYILSSNFMRCVACKFFLQNLNFWQFFKLCNFYFVLFQLGIWCESLGWVIMGQRGVSHNAGILVVLVEAEWHHMMMFNMIYIGSGNGLLPDGTKPIPEPMLTTSWE